MRHSEFGIDIVRSVEIVVKNDLILEPVDVNTVIVPCHTAREASGETASNSERRKLSVTTLELIR